MMIAPRTIRQDYWETFELSDSDLEFLYNYLLENEYPKTPEELVRVLVNERIRAEKKSLLSQQQGAGKIYLPKDHYDVGQTLVFPALDYQSGKVTSVRPGSNPELPPFEVIEVSLQSGDQRSFAAGLDQHALNAPITVNLDDPNLDTDAVLENYGPAIEDSLTELFENNPDIVRIAGSWFPRALLVDVNIGYLNLAEALLDMEGGGPLPTSAILEQIELPTDVNLKLTEFSLNLALQEDGRFDEVGPAGEILWFLRRLEPASVQNTPMFLRNHSTLEYDRSVVGDLLTQIQRQVFDELEPPATFDRKAEKATLGLIYPHWRAGTLPLVGALSAIFPTAIESPRVLFTFVDANTGKSFLGWVVLKSRYVYGLSQWYKENELLPGSLVTVSRGKKRGEVMIKVEKRRPARDWLKTALVGVDGGIVFLTQKQPVSSTYDDRLTIAVPNHDALDAAWESGAKNHQNLEQVVKTSMRELTKLSPQGHVHAIELYAAVNLAKRCPPGPILWMLADRPWSTHLGDLYFRITDEKTEENA